MRTQIWKTTYINVFHSIFKDNNVHKYRTYQPPLKTSGLPFSATSAPFLPRFFSNPLIPVVSAERINPPPPPPPPFAFPFPEPIPLPQNPTKRIPYRLLAFGKKQNSLPVFWRDRVFFLKPVSRNRGRRCDGHVSADRDGLRFRFWIKKT